MSQATDYASILAAALALPSTDRQLLAGQLQESLRAEVVAALGDEGLALVRERLARYRAGKSRTWTMEELAEEVARRRSSNSL